MSHKILRQCIVKVIVLGYFPLYIYICVCVYIYVCMCAVFNTPYYNTISYNSIRYNTRVIL